MALPASPQTVAERISLKDFFDNLKISGAAISPDGKRLAFLAPESNRLNVWVSDVGNGLDSAKVITHDGPRRSSLLPCSDRPEPGGADLGFAAIQG